jgi:glycosyltransferase involved in cell wall biosynthesis
MTYGVITACLNSSSTIRRTIESVFSQTVLPDEYIFVDGGSTDQTVDIIKEAMNSVEGKKSGFKSELLYQYPSSGIAAAWNMGLNRISSDIVFILNSDDWYEKDTAQKILTLFNNQQELDIILGSARYYSKEDNTPVRELHAKSFLFLPFLMNVIHPACFVKRAVYQKIGLFNEQYKVAADYDFIYRCYNSSVHFRRIRDVVTNMDLGGFAGKNKEISRKELLEIGLRYGGLKVLPKTAYFIRVLMDW